MIKISPILTRNKDFYGIDGYGIVDADNVPIDLYICSKYLRSKVGKVLPKRIIIILSSERIDNSFDIYIRVNKYYGRAKWGNKPTRTRNTIASDVEPQICDALNNGTNHLYLTVIPIP